MAFWREFLNLCVSDVSAAKAFRFRVRNPRRTQNPTAAVSCAPQPLTPCKASLNFLILLSLSLTPRTDGTSGQARQKKEEEEEKQKSAGSPDQD